MSMVSLDQMASALFVLLGFQVVAFTWRLNRELDVRKTWDPLKPSPPVRSEPDGKERCAGVENWFPPADCLNLLSMFLTVAAILTMLMGCSMCWPNAFMRGSLVLLVCHPIALLVHYGLSPFHTNCYEGKQPRCARYEAEVVFSAIALALGVMVGGGQ